MTTKKTKDETVKIKWACPKCGAKANAHGRGECDDRHLGSAACQGFVCECMSSETDDKNHGLSFETICHTATCYHCGWGGRFPQKPKGLQAWEKKALDAGWMPSPARRKELGL